MEEIKVADLKKEAKALGLTVDKRWNKTTLARKVAEAKGEAEKPKLKDGNLPVILLRNYRPADNSEKRWRGDEIDLPANEAKFLVKAGIADRNDDFGN